MGQTGCLSRADHRDRWVVTARKGYRNPGHDMRWIPTRNSTVYCPTCGQGWRTSALYVDSLPDHGVSARELEPRLVRIEKLVEEYPLLAELTYLGNGGTADRSRFLTDVGARMVHYGELTPRQVFAVESAVQKFFLNQQVVDERHGDLQRKWEAIHTLADGTVLPEGWTTVVGPVLELTEGNDPYLLPSQQLKITIKSEPGYLVEVTYPSPLRRLLGTDIVGRKVSIKMKLRQHNHDGRIAHGSYPRDSTVLGDPRDTVIPEDR